MGYVSHANMIANLPFNSLRTFEAVARLRGFGRAAEELGVTQSAVSQQVKSLEEWLGVRLITRGGGRVVPTEEGARLAAEVLRGFGGVASLCRALRETPSEPLALNLSCLPGFAYVWLIPRLIGFDQLHPDIPVSITTTAQMATFTDDDIDLAIRYGPGGYTGLHVERLLTETLFPVCAPELLQRGPPLRTPADLVHHTLLVDDVADAAGIAPTWDYWARERSVTLPRGLRQRRFGQSNMVIQAAERGMGVALGRSPLVVDALRRGTLIRPFAGEVASGFSYWLVCPVTALDVPRIRVFRDWLKQEAAQCTLSPGGGA
jgi:LysR family transcriptional regulator, glycine cleavage system transcriptional activator